MLVGMVGVLVPVLPGLLVVWLAAVLSLLWQGADGAAWLGVGWFTLLFALGTLATVALPARRGRETGVPSGSLAAAVAGAVAGFMLLPVAGFVVGGLVGLYLAERLRLGTGEAARRSTGAVLRAYGLGVLIELLLGFLLIGSWLTLVILRFG